MSAYVVSQFYGVITTIESNTDYTSSNENIDTSTRATLKRSESADAIVQAAPDVQKTNYANVLRSQSMSMSMLCEYYTEYNCYTDYMRVVDYSIGVNMSQGWNFVSLL
jgi:hypothetical protein